MQKLIYTFFFLCFLTQLQAQIQPQRAVVQLSAYRDQVESHRIPIDNPQPFLAYAVIWQGDADALRIRFSENGTDWEAWQPMTIDEHLEQSPERRVSELYFTKKTDQFFQITGLTTQTEVHFYSPDATPAEATQMPARPRSEACVCAQPTYQARTNWCSDGNCPPNPAPDFTETTHLIVHHSAGTNVANDWAAIVRSIWNFHVNINGWSDIGYNWLVDPNGVVYEGRGDGIQGAHFCGKNSGTTGICVLGDFTNVEPTEAAKNELIELLSWKSCDQELDPRGIAFHASSQMLLNNISGHRDGCNTSCPGDLFYPLLPNIRQGVVDFIANNCSVATTADDILALENFQLTPNPARETLQLAFTTERKGTFSVDIYNTLGIHLQHFAFQKNGLDWQQQIDIMNLASGVYWLRLQHERQIVSQKFIKN